jgi:diguanylate cyclase (GGDEF)-like protein
VLAAVGTTLNACLRAGDFAGRFGGEEFLILLPNADATAALQVAERIRTAIAGIAVVGVERDITASLGLADLLEYAGSPDGLLHEADRALYTAKALGRNRIVTAHPVDATAATTSTANSEGIDHRLEADPQGV